MGVGSLQRGPRFAGALIGKRMDTRCGERKNEVAMKVLMTPAPEVAQILPYLVYQDINW